MCGQPKIPLQKVDQNDIQPTVKKCNTVNVTFVHDYSNSREKAIQILQTFKDWTEKQCEANAP